MSHSAASPFPTVRVRKPRGPAPAVSIAAFQAAATPGIIALAEHGVQQSYRAKTVLINEGDYGDTLYIVLSGKLRVYVSGAKNKEFTLGLYGMGDYVGEMSLDGGPRSATVQTVAPSVCALVSRDILREHIASHPDFAFEIMARLIRRARLATESVRSLALLDSYGRLTRLLDQLATPGPEGTRIVRDRLTHNSLAQQISCSREMVSRLLKDLQNGGYLTTVDQRLVLLKPMPTGW